MSGRWQSADVAEYDRRRRSASGFVEVGPKIVRRGHHKSMYLYHACAYARAIGIEEPVGEHYFDRDREWRLDLAWPEQKVAIEIDGGLYVQGAHARGAGIERDQEKHNAAVLAGWRVLRTTPTDLAKAMQLAKRMLT